MTSRIAIAMPRLNANDDSGLLAVWLKSAGDAVRRGELIAQIETTKATVDLEAPEEGFLHPLVEAGAMVAVGQDIAWIVGTYDEAALTAAARAPAAAAERPAGARLVSRKAQEMIRAAGLRVEDVPGDGPVGTAEAEAFIARAGKAGNAAGADQLDRLTIDERSVVLFGASDQGSVVADALLAEGRYVPLCFADDRPKQAAYADLPVFAAAMLPELKRRGVRNAHVCIGDPRAKLRVAEQLKAAGFTIVPAIHPRAHVAPSASLGEGVYIGPGVVIGPYAVIGAYSQVNNNATVPHHVRLGVGVRVSDGANIAGGVRVGDRAYLGLGVTVNTGCHIGQDVTIVSGVSVFDAVADGTTVRARNARA